MRYMMSMQEEDEYRSENCERCVHEIKCPLWETQGETIGAFSLLNTEGWDMRCVMFFKTEGY